MIELSRLGIGFILFLPITPVEAQFRFDPRINWRTIETAHCTIHYPQKDSLLSGFYTVPWDASNLASGVYLYRLQAGDYVETRKMVLMR